VDRLEDEMFAARIEDRPPETGACGLQDCGEIGPWLSKSFPACFDRPENQGTQGFLDCYTGEAARQRTALATAEQALLTRLPAADAQRLRAAQADWAAAETLYADALSADDGDGTLATIAHVRARLDYVVRRRIDLDRRLGRLPGQNPKIDALSP
jgi:hypothetical protein